MPQIDELIKNLEAFAKNNVIIKDFLEIFIDSKKEEKWEKFKNKYCPGKKQCRVEDILKNQLKEYLEKKGYQVSSTKKETKLDEKFFEVDTYTDLRVDLNENTTVFIELKLNYPSKKDNGSSYKKWGYEEFIALRDKFDYREQGSVLILFIIDAVVGRKLLDYEKELLKNTENLSVIIVRVFLNSSNKTFEIEVVK